MKSIKLTILFIVLSTFTMIAQQKDIVITSYQNGNDMVLYAVNNTSITNQVTLFLQTTGLKKHDNEITKLVSPKDSVLMVTLTAVPGKQPSMNSRYQYQPKPTKAEKETKEKVLAKKAYKPGDDLAKGIVIFDKSDCSRCNRSTSYLLDQNIDFTWIQIPSNDQVKNNKVPEQLKKNRELLSQKMNELGYSGSYTTPVFLVNGKLTHSHADLMGFLSGLK